MHLYYYLYLYVLYCVQYARFLKEEKRDIY